ncbi:hypothetical protein GALMADRAFT_67468, partial [Galerina marginata CBS 339.88]
MIGGDYSDGLEGCGQKTAHGLVKCGFGDSLLLAINTLDGDNLRTFLNSWICDIRKELISNSRGFLPSCRPQLAASISHEFISPQVIEFYVRPVSSFFPTPGPLPTPWKPGGIRINRLASFCANDLGWKEGTGLRKTFHANLWEGVFLQMLISPWVLYDSLTHIMRTNNLQTTICELQSKRRQTRHLSPIKFWYRVRISTEYFVKM